MDPAKMKSPSSAHAFRERRLLAAPTPANASIGKGSQSAKNRLRGGEMLVFWALPLVWIVIITVVIPVGATCAGCAPPVGRLNVQTGG